MTTPLSTPLSVAVIGRGDNATLFAAFLEGAGAHVSTFATASDAAGATENAGAEPNNDTIYADISPGTPASKRSVAPLFPSGSYIDVTALSPVVDRVDTVRWALSGESARTLVEYLEPSALTLDYVSDTPGDATARRLIRDLFDKGLAAVLVDSLWAAQSLGAEKWMLDEIRRTFDDMSAHTAERYLENAALHVKRQQIEMLDIVEMLADTTYDSTMLAPIEFTFGRILHNKKVPRGVVAP